MGANPLKKKKKRKNTRRNFWNSVIQALYGQKLFEASKHIDEASSVFLIHHFTDDETEHREIK